MKHFGAFALDTANGCLWREDTHIVLAPKPFAVLRYLVEHAGRLVTHDELLDALWPQTFVQPQVLRTYVLELRKALGDNAAKPVFIQTLPKRGYCFAATVTEAGGVRSLATPAASAAELSQIAGREKELALLAARVDSAGRGSRQVVFLSGEAGIGKSALAEAFSQQRTRSRLATVARGQCIEGLGPREEYYPVMEMLGRLCAPPTDGYQAFEDAATGERIRRVLGRAAPAWLAALRPQSGAPGMAASAAVAAPEARLAGDLCAALEEIAAETPLILLIEDLQWADEATLHLVSALARRRGDARLMVLLTCRPASTGSAPVLADLRQDLSIHRMCTDLPLGPLTRGAVHEVLCTELKQPGLPPGLADFIYKHSEGNPLFVLALLEHLIAERCLSAIETQGAVEWRQTKAFAEAGVPGSLRQMIELEVERLSQHEQRMLEAGSLLEVAFPAWAVATALGQDQAAIEEACDSLARRLYFLERAGQDEIADGMPSAFYVFAHGLYRDVLYQRQPAMRRATMHVRIARRLGEVFAGREALVAREMAAHYEGAAQWQAATDALQVAALHAQQRHAYAEASDLLKHGLRIARNLGESDGEATMRKLRSQLASVEEAGSVLTNHAKDTTRRAS